MRIFQTITVLVVFVCCQRHGVAIQEDDVTKMREHFLQTQTELADHELQELQYKFDANVEVCDELLTSLTKEIEDSADFMVEMHRGSGIFDQDDHLCVRLRKSIWKEFAKELPVEKQAAFEAHQVEEIEALRQSDNVAINDFLVYWDGRLCLSESQLEKLRELYAENWFSGFNEIMMHSHFACPPSQLVIDLVDEAELKKLLSERQLEYLRSARAKGWAYYDGSGWIELRRKSEPVDQNVAEEMKLVCNFMMDMKIAEYGELVGADDEQLKRLRIMKKRVISKVMDPIEAGIKQFPLVDEMQSDSLQSRCYHDEFWMSKIGDVFDSEQLEKIAERERIRREAWIDQAVQSVMECLVRRNGSPELKMNREQFTELVEMVKTEIRCSDRAQIVFRDNRNERDSLAKCIGDVPNRKFQRIMTEGQWDVFSENLSYYRRNSEYFLR